MYINKMTTETEELTARYANRDMSGFGFEYVPGLVLPLLMLEHFADLEDREAEASVYGHDISTYLACDRAYIREYNEYVRWHRINYRFEFELNHLSDYDSDDDDSDDDTPREKSD